jgi:UDP-glucose 4-epimerase
VDALRHLALGGGSVVLNCGYGRGHTVREVLRAVERAAGRPVPVRMAPRRPGDPPALVARAARIGEVLAWRPAFDDLNLIVCSALAWERRMAAERGCHPLARV